MTKYSVQGQRRSFICSLNNLCSSSIQAGILGPGSSVSADLYEGKTIGARLQRALQHRRVHLVCIPAQKPIAVHLNGDMGAAV